MKTTGSITAIGCTLPPACGEPARRARLRTSGQLNGIDYIEVGDDGVTLCVHLFGDIPQEVGVTSVRVSGGRRITGLRVLSVTAEQEPDMHDDACLRVVLDRTGDHTPYCLCLVDAAASGKEPATWQPYPGFDPRYACAELRFRLDCPQPLDCATETPCVEPPPVQPEINYLAKDYASFRQLFLDRMALTIPQWQERHVPDIGIAVVETLAYTADYLSYYQDAVATEAYLGTARRRISVRRHARLVDYRLHEGCNARALVTIASDNDVTLPFDNLLLLVPPPGQADAKPGVIDAIQFDKARAQGALVFEPMALDGATTLNVVAAHSTIRFHTWGDELCCLPRGSTRATLVYPLSPVPVPAPTSTPGASPPTASASQPIPGLKKGDLLIFEEVLGPQTGNPADADPAHRHALRLTAAEPSVDPLDGTPLLEIAWDACDALPFDLCLSVRTPAPDCTWLHDISVARGNVLLVDHGEHVRGQCTCDAICTPTGEDGDYPGLTATLAALPDACQRCHDLTEDCWLVPGTVERGCCRCEGAVQDVTRPPADTSHALPGGPLTFAEPLPANAPVCKLLARDPRAALPQVTVYGGALGDVLVSATPDARWRWQSRCDLLESGPDDRHFVVEIDDDGIAQLRFGDGVLGRQPQAGEFFRAAPRIGNGLSGNVGRDSIVWLALKSGPPPGAGLVPRNPLPAAGGTAPESIAEAKLYAPGAFRAQPLRAIVADDYAMFATRTPQLQGAACALEWTGSWYEAHVVADPLGREVLPRTLATRIAADLEHYRRIGHDVAVSGACYVPLLIALHVCVLPDFLVAHVEAELRDRFSSRLRRDGTPGFFHPDRLKLGAPVYASALLAEAQAVAGVAHVEVTTLARIDGGREGDVPADGVLKIAPREIARVDNDPDYPDHGSITFTFGGGR
jgi:hypothetical protein